MFGGARRTLCAFKDARRTECGASQFLMFGGARRTLCAVQKLGAIFPQ
jgi:hypothetical protein